MAAIEARELTKSFTSGGRGRRRRTVEAVRNISFTVDAGERLAYIGPNGAGKSTSIKMLTGILHPTHGDARVLGYTPWSERKKLVRHIGTLFGQRSQLWFELTPRRSFTLLGAIYGLDGPLARRVDELADLLEAGDLFDVPVRNLSLGQRMRCELAATMLHSPRVIFLDEPTIGLDLVAKQRFRDMVVRLNEDEGTTIFLTSHDVSDIEQVAKRVIVINHGTIIYDDSVSRMRRSLLNTKLLEVRFEEEPGSIAVDGITVIKGRGVGYKLSVDTERHSIRAVLDDLLDRHRVADISVLDPPLEEIIGRIYEAPRT
ncbi:MAG TPA: ATP-binding cassette domain-containing protein [Actinomycetota bacterium]|nr:ATP-binding cassette domain-containing protein [Actinomycetota bacterium]